MKKSVSLVHYLLLLLAVLPIGGCRLEHYDRSEIVEWADKNFDKRVTISRDYIQRLNDDGYTDHVWEASLKDDTGLKFEIISHKYYGLESVTCSIESTWRSVYGEYFFNQYTTEHHTEYAPAEQWNPTGRYLIAAFFDDRIGMDALFAEAAQIEAFMEAFDAPDCLSYDLILNDPVGSPRYTDVTERISGEKMEKVRDKLLMELALNCADHRFDLEQFTLEELENVIAEDGRPFVLTLSDGSQREYSDLTLSRFGHGMSFGTLYEVLVREGYDVQGSSADYTFTGIDGNEYRMSYSFNDYPYNTGSGVMNGYYYLRNGEEVPMEYFFYNHFRSQDIEKMTGFSFTGVSRKQQ